MRGAARAAAAALLALALLLAADRLLAPPDLVMALLAACAAGASAGFAAWILWPLRRGPTDRQVARYVEERCPDLQDRLASAIDLCETPSPFGGRVLDDAARRSRGVDLDRVVAARVVRRAVAGGVGATAALVALLVVGADVVGRIARSAWLYAAPFGATLIVEPGAARLVAGEPLEVRARLADTLGAFGRSAPSVTVIAADGGRTTVDMQPHGAGYAATLPPAARSFTYRVAAAALESEDYAVTVLHAPRAERVDVAYQYPAFTGLAARVETGGDVFAPQGTLVTVTVHSDKPVSDGALRLAAGGVIPLRREAPAALSASFEVTRDDAYRIALRDADGLSNLAAAEYVIRATPDAPPLVEVRRPGGDREITPLEEVVIEAHAEDDFALARFDLVYAVAGSADRVVDLLGPDRVANGDGVHTLYAEDLDVAPGDVISYYIRAGDANPARVRETRSDHLFPGGAGVRAGVRGRAEPVVAVDGRGRGRAARGRAEGDRRRDLATGRPAGARRGGRGPGGGGRRAGRTAPDRARRRGADAPTWARASGAAGAGRRGGRDGAGGGSAAIRLDRRGAAA